MSDLEKLCFNLLSTAKMSVLIKKCALILLLVLTSLSLVVVLRTLVLFRNTKEFDSCSPTKQHHVLNSSTIVSNFIESLRFKTVTKAPGQYDREELKKFINFVKLKFPSIHNSSLINFELINDLTLFYTIKGSDTSLRPYLLISHFDVVPVEENNWHFEPFSGVIKDDYIYGRGALDVKDAVMGILESLEFLISRNSGFKPRRSFYISLGHDEEGRGLDGNRMVAQVFRQRNISDLEYILDEGSMIYQEVQGLNKPLAMISVSEKGMLSLKLTARGKVGHSSVPPHETAIVTLSKALAKLDSNAHPNLFGTGIERTALEAVASHASFGYKLLLANLWLFGPILANLMSYHDLLNSFVRTTTAVTTFRAGIKENVLPSEAVATVNHRIHPLNSVAQVIEHDRKIINDERVSIEISGVAIEPHPVSPFDKDNFGYQTIRRSILEVFPDVIVTPGLMLASTDSRWYIEFSKNIYRFSPAVITVDDLSRIHGNDERIGVDNYIKLVNFYYHLMIASDSPTLTPQVKPERVEL